MGSSKKKDKDRERTREEKAERKRKKRDRENRERPERSRSRSKDREREKEREKEKRSHRHRHKHKKHHKKSSREERDRSRERDQSHERDGSRSRSRSASISISDLDSVSDPEEFIEINDDGEVILEAPPPPKITRTASPPPPPAATSGDDGGRSGGGGSGGGGEITLSIEETNRLRAKLGLKPLSVDSVKKSAPEPKKEDDDDDEDGMEQDGFRGVSTANQTCTVDGETFVHKPADNLANKLKVEKLREKIKANKEKRAIKSKLSKIKTLGESDGEEDDAMAWIKRSRKLAKDKAEADKKLKMMEELDEQFGIGDMVNQEINVQKEKKYSHRNLSGLKIQHDMDTFNDGSSTILTLADGLVLDDGAEDTLVNVNMVDDERAAINVENRKKKTDETEYEAPEMDAFGNLVQKTVLTKYDEEIAGLKKKSFRIGYGGMAMRDEEDLRQVNTSVQRIAKMRKLQALDVPKSQLASEYMTQDEMVSFKKPKKKEKEKEVQCR